VARYGQAFKDRAVARLLPPESAALKVVSREVGIAMDTLKRWAHVRSVQARPRAGLDRACARLDPVITAASMNEADVNKQI